MIILVDEAGFVDFRSFRIVIGEPVESDLTFPIPDASLSQLHVRRKMLTSSPNTVAVISDYQVVLELMETHLQRLAAIIEEARATVPSTTSCKPFQGLSGGQDLFVADSSPKSFVVIRAPGFFWLIRFHLMFSEVLQSVRNMF